jgi:hypothetical protein
LQILLKHAIHLELITVNPAAAAGLKGSKPSGRIWSRAAVTEFVAEADALGHHSIGTAVLVNHWLGQREEDILAFPLVGWRNGRFAITQLKTGKRVLVQDNPAVRARVEAELERQRIRRQGLAASAFAGDRRRAEIAATTLLLCEETMLPWREDNFRHVFAEIRAGIGARLPVFTYSDGSTIATLDLQFRHLRHTAVTELAIAGCTHIQIAAITGHSVKTIATILERYLVLTSDLADSATDKRAAWDAARERGER